MCANQLRPKTTLAPALDLDFGMRNQLFGTKLRHGSPYIKLEPVRRPE